MRVLCLDCDLDLAGADTFSFGGAISIFDYDVVFWDPKQSLDGYTVGARTFQGLASLTAHNSAKIAQDIERRHSEFREFLAMGRTLVVFLPGETKVYRDTGERTHSGTGKNRATTRLLDGIDILSALPTQVTRLVGGGVEIIPASDLASSLFRETKNCWAYRSLLNTQEGMEPLFYVKGTQKYVGGLIREGDTRGTLVLLPDFEFSDDGTDGDDVPSPDSARLLEWVATLTDEPDSSLPAWTVDYQFPSEVTRTAERVKLDSEVSTLQAKIETLNALGAQDERWKALITASGTPLERRVRESLEVFGFTFEEVEPGRSDARGIYQDERIVVEVKGVAKSAAEKHAAQLEKWVSDELAQDRVAKGVLVVNGWRSVPLRDRDQDDFPAQMLGYSQQRGHCLISGLQLLAMTRAVLDDPARADEMARIILDTVGPVDNWSDVDALFPPQSPAQVITDAGATD